MIDTHTGTYLQNCRISEAKEYTFYPYLKLPKDPPALLYLGALPSSRVMHPDHGSHYLYLIESTLYRTVVYSLLYIR